MAGERGGSGGGAGDRERRGAEPAGAAGEPRGVGRPSGAGTRRGGAPDYGELAWRAQAAYLRLLAERTGAEVRSLGRGFAVASGLDSNASNGVVCSCLSPDADATIARVAAGFRERGLPATWLVGPAVEPADLRERLAAGGWRPEHSAVVMGAELNALDVEPRPGDPEIVPVRDDAALDAWLALAAEHAWLVDERERARVRASALALGLDPAAPVQRVLARRRGRIVGVASTRVDGATVSLDDVAVLPLHRRHGSGRALVRERLRAARAAGCRYAVLEPTPDSQAFHAVLGFVTRPFPPDRAFYLEL